MARNSSMKNLFILFTVLIHFNVFANCGDRKLELSDIKEFFRPGSMTSKAFTTLKLKKRVRRCNSFSGCEKWSKEKATLTLGEVISSYDTQMRYHYFPYSGEAYFKVTNQGQIQLLINFYHLDISARVNYKILDSKISIKSNNYFRPSGAHVHPSAFASYHAEDEKNPFNLEGHIGKDCMELSSTFIQNQQGIMYDEFEVSLNGSL